MCFRPHEPRQHAGQWTGKAFDRVGGDRQSERREARRIAVGIENECADLGPESLDDVLDHGPAGKEPHALVAAAHAAREPSGEENARDVGLTELARAHVLLRCDALLSS